MDPKTKGLQGGLVSVFVDEEEWFDMVRHGQYIQVGVISQSRDS